VGASEKAVSTAKMIMIDEIDVKFISLDDSNTNILGGQVVSHYPLPRECR